MNILVVQNGGIPDVMVTTSLLASMVRDGHAVYCITNNESGKLLSTVKGVEVSFLPEVKEKPTYDLAVNLHPDETGGAIMNYVNAEQKRGYGFDGEHIVFFDKCSDLHYRTTRLGVWNDNNLFQLLYGMAGWSWKGEGYAMQYLPRNRQKKSLTGVCVKDLELRQYILRNLKVKGKISTVPLKQNVLKQIDEINRCRNIVTDDEGCMHIGLALRKHVEYVSKRPPAYGLELFSSGNIHVFNTENVG